MAFLRIRAVFDGIRLTLFNLISILVNQSINVMFSKMGLEIKNPNTFLTRKQPVSPPLSRPPPMLILGRYIFAAGQSCFVQLLYTGAVQVSRVPRWPCTALF